MGLTDTAPRDDAPQFIHARVPVEIADLKVRLGAERLRHLTDLRGRRGENGRDRLKGLPQQLVARADENDSRLHVRGSVRGSRKEQRRARRCRRAVGAVRGLRAEVGGATARPRGANATVARLHVQDAAQAMRGRTLPQMRRRCSRRQAPGGMCTCTRRLGVVPVVQVQKVGPLHAHPRKAVRGKGREGHNDGVRGVLHEAL
ncbi:hypothetical protein STCU_11903 [Strigomonas culicis]|uniref:Uncharacterized protein n=1 Tax=Strigomonas culicis TaxID=28005 RepID=S9TH13_9TRYP|nr:hypothetical protein STCU_11903 [Strigomonas culicis]|eukprot:EPY15593.1 hypothetical protein STCU_11903 [Strigomonas culicis]